MRVVNVRHSGIGGFLRISGHHALEDRPMLRTQLVARLRTGEQGLAVLDHTRRSRPDNARIVCRTTRLWLASLDRDVQVDIRLRLLAPDAALVSAVDAIHTEAEPLAIDAVRAFGREAGR